MDTKIEEILANYGETDNLPLSLVRAAEMNRSKATYIKICETGEVCNRLEKIDELLEISRNELTLDDVDDEAWEEMLAKAEEVYWVECNAEGRELFELMGVTWVECNAEGRERFEIMGVTKGEEI